jgi:SAM-dependent methyltransferase
MHETPLDLTESRMETKVDDLRRFSMLEFEIKNKKLIEIGSGNGGMLLLEKLRANLVIGIEPDKRFHKHFKAEGLRIYSRINDYTRETDNSNEQKADIVTSFHVIEHVKNPLEFLLEILNLLKQGGKAYVETPNSNDALIKLYDSTAFKDFTYWDNHLQLFNKKSFEFMLKRITEITFRSIPVQRYGIANHLFWLANSKPGGHLKWSYLENIQLNEQYKEVLSDLNMNDTLFYEITKTSQVCSPAS